MQLRPYQQNAVSSVYEFLRSRDGNPAICLPTAAGKSLCIAQIAKDSVLQWNGRVLILAHVQELIEQNADKVRRLAPDVSVGIYSAGIGSRQTQAPVIVAGIQSVYRRAKELGHFDLVIVDEAHLIQPDGDGMYRTLLSELKAINPLLRIIGLTATPYRMSTGPICAPENILNAICFEVGIRELIMSGFLCPLKNKAGREKIDTGGLHIRGGEFIASEVEALMDEDRLVEAACKEIVEHTRERHSVLVFASGVKHGQHVAESLERRGQRVATVFGDTLDFERGQFLEDFKAGNLKYLVNVNVLTTGFDAPNIDCVALLRPTLSPGLYYQMIGRGFRLHSSKKDCLVLDFGGNVLRHGPVDAVQVHEIPGQEGEAPAKECPQCNSIIATGFTLCPECGFAFPPRKVRHDATASETAVLSGQATVKTYPVQEVRYSVHSKRGAPSDAPRTLRVEYRMGFNRYQSEWICIEHDGFARQKAEAWWKKRSSEPTPDSAMDACELAAGGALREPKAITIRSIAGESFDRIVGYDWAAESAPSDSLSEPDYVPANDSIPF